jgi:hypothetical protein
MRLEEKPWLHPKGALRRFNRRAGYARKLANQTPFVLPMKMKKTIFVLVLFAVLCVVGGISCSTLTGVATSSHADWTFIQSVGGLDVSASPNSALIPVYCDVSGVKPATPGTTAVNSGLVVRRERYKLKGNTILYWIETCVVTKAHTSPVTKGIRIPDLLPGEYSLEYLNPDGTTVEVCRIEVNK